MINFLKWNLHCDAMFVQRWHPFCTIATAPCAFKCADRSAKTVILNLGSGLSKLPFWSQINFKKITYVAIEAYNKPFSVQSDQLSRNTTELITPFTLFCETSRPNGQTFPSILTTALPALPTGAQRRISASQAGPVSGLVFLPTQDKEGLTLLMSI